MKLLQRMIIMSMVLTLCVSCVMPTAFAAAGAEESDIDPVIQIEFDDYISSKEYYRSLLEDGYTLIVHVGEENEDAGLAEFTSYDDVSADADQNESAIVPYNDYGPIHEWNVHLQGTRSINGKAEYSNVFKWLYTNYYFTGASTFELALYNNGDNNVDCELKYKSDHTRFNNFVIPAQSSVLKYVHESSWYARFKKPCNITGKVNEFIMH